ncbi:MAG: ankyrin repeat domain-containing protein [Planctomycetota bacterium]|jgi:ankyrin repeat protein
MSTNRVMPVLAGLVLLTAQAAGCSSESEPAAETTPAARADAAPAPPAADVPDVVDPPDIEPRPDVETPPETEVLPDVEPARDAAVAAPDVRPPAPRPDPAVPAPGLVVIAEPARLDLGEVPTGETTTGTVTLRHTGDRPMRIVKTKTSCGCTTARIQDGRVIYPGNAFDVEIRMEAGQTARVLNKTVTFTIEGQPPLVVPVRCEAIAYIAVEPTRLHPDAQPDGRFTLTSRDGAAFRVISMVPPLLESFPETASPAVELAVPWERFREFGRQNRLIVRTDHPRCGQVSVAVDLAGTPYDDVPRKPLVPRSPSDYESTIALGRGPMLLERIAGGELAVDTRDASGATLLGLSAKLGNVDMVEALLAAGADVDAADRAGRTPLMSASESGSAETYDLLLEAGASLTERDNIGGTALSWAAAFADRECVVTLIDAGARVDDTGSVTGYTPLIWAAGFGDPASIEPLVEAGAALETADTLEGLTPLMHAARTGRVEAVRILLEQGADLETTDNVGRTALLAAAAAAGGTVEKLEALIEAGADVRARDERDQGALALARRRTDPLGPEVVAYLESILGGGGG